GERGGAGRGVPGGGADDDPRRAASDAVLQLVWALEREVGYDLVSRARGKPLDVLDTPQRTKPPRGTCDERRRWSWVRGDRKCQPVAVHCDRRRAPERHECAITTRSAWSSLDAVELHRQAVDPLAVLAERGDLLALPAVRERDGVVTRLPGLHDHLGSRQRRRSRRDGGRRGAVATRAEIRQQRD